MKKLSGFIASCIIAIVSIAGCSDSNNTSFESVFTHNDKLYYIFDADILYSASDNTYRTLRFIGSTGTEELGVQFTFEATAFPGEIPVGEWTLFNASNVSAVDLIPDTDSMAPLPIYIGASGSLDISGTDGEKLRARIDYRYDAGTVAVGYDGNYNYNETP